MPRPHLKRNSAGVLRFQNLNGSSQHRNTKEACLPRNESVVVFHTRCVSWHVRDPKRHVKERKSEFFHNRTPLTLQLNACH